MKKILFILTLLFIPFGVLAATGPTVLTLTAESDGSTVNYEGTISGNSTAVMCKLLDANDGQADMLSTDVDNGAFSGNFTGVANGTYTVACADYDGGEVKTADVVVGDGTTATDETSTTSSSSAKTTTSNPKTYDEGIRNSIILFVICVAGVIGSSIYLKRRKSLKNN